MSKEYSNDDVGFSSVSAYADPAPIKKEENKIAKSPSAAPKITDAALTANASAANAAEPAVPAASVPVLPPLQAASAGTPPAIQNPAQTGDFWKSALAGAGIPLGIGLASAAGGYMLGKGRQPAAEAIPAGGATPPVDANAPVQAPLSRLEELKIKQYEHDLAVKQAAEQRASAAFEADQRRADELHQRAIAEKDARIAKQAERAAQQSPGKAYGKQDSTILSNIEEMQMKAAASQAGVEKLKQPDPITQQKSQQANAAVLQSEAQWATPEEAAAQQAKKSLAPAANTAPAPIDFSNTQTVPDAAAPAAKSSNAPVVPAAEKVAAAEAKLKWPGGSEGSALQNFFGATKKTLAPEHMAGLEMFKDYVGGSLAPSTGGTVKELDQANSFVKKYTGEGITAGKRMPEEQIQKLHAGIRTELEDAVKGDKLGKLGKGAMSAAALLGLTTAVQAAQKGDFGPLNEAGFSGLLAKAIGGVATTALTPIEAGAPVVGYSKQEQQTRDVAQRPGVRAYSEILKNRLSGEEYNKAISDFAATNPKRGDYAAMQELFRQQAEKKSKR